MSLQTLSPLLPQRKCPISTPGMYEELTLSDRMRPAQTVCNANPAEKTVLFYGEPQTEYDVEYVTYTTSETVWVGYVLNYS